MPDPRPLLPQVTDDDIELVQSIMSLRDFDEPRKTFLRSNTTLDVSACPGSGKTTMVVAKLAILARKWPHRTKGICILSHTNAARAEIQNRLGGTSTGQSLFGYPHYIDTIHGFVNRFLAMPWLDSNGFPSPTIDDDVTTTYRRGVLTNKEYWTVQNCLANKHSGFDRLRICDCDLGFDICGKPFPASSSSNSFQLAKRAIEASAQAGYFCYNEMFVWAKALLEEFPEVSSWLRRRFPLVMIDEMQDTTVLQGNMLSAIFPHGSADVVVQRIGDPNQALFDDESNTEPESDPFPDSHWHNVPNSYRFGSVLATLASPFAVTQVGDQGLCGIGPTTCTDEPVDCPHAIFIFPDDSTAGVLDVYGKHVLSIFSDQALGKGDVAAVGGVHKDYPDVCAGDKKFPKSVSHYWGCYTPEISRKKPHPRFLVQYVRASQDEVHYALDLSPGVDRIASGLARLARYVGDASRITRKTKTHRAVVEALATNSEALAAYRRLIRTFLIDWEQLTEESWNARQTDILCIARALCEELNDPDDAASNFLSWKPHDLSLSSSSSGFEQDAGPNVYRFEDGGRRVDIRLGSIHSVKGQTHLATMVLNTHRHKHSSQRMLPWLLGEKVNSNGAGVQDRGKLIQTYVAMTRPSHLVCFAIPRFAFGNDDKFTRQVDTLKSRGWRLAEINGDDTKWLD